MKVRVVFKGGPGSGHHGHEGRPGLVGGSASGKGVNLGSKLEGIKSKIATAAQKVVDEWEQDEEGFDFVYGAGGACDDVCLEMGQVITENIEGDLEILDGGQEGDDHAWLVVHDVESGDAYGVDIPPGVYETGGGYNWKKIAGAIITPEDVEIWKLDIDLAQPNELFGWE